MKRTTFALLSMMAASGSVLAVENWQGLYTDLRAGAGFNPGDNGELEFRRADGSNNRAAIDGAFGDNFNGEFNAGSLLGAAIGYKFQQDRWVYGAEFSLSSKHCPCALFSPADTVPWPGLIVARISDNFWCAANPAARS